MTRQRLDELLVQRGLYTSRSRARDAVARGTVTVDGVVAARMTGAGFGGCTVNLVERGRADELRVAIKRDYPGRTGLKPSVFVVEAADGAGFVG